MAKLNPSPTSNDFSLKGMKIGGFYWAVLLTSFVIFALVLSSPVRYTYGDSRYAMLTSQSFIENGSPKLDEYANKFDLSALNKGQYWMVFRQGVDSHYYYDYPIGTPIFSLPFVAVGRMLGMNMLDREDDASMQMGIASLLCVAIFLLLIRLSKLYLDDWAALVFASLIFFGSSFASTMGTALWSQNFQAFFVLLIILELAEAVAGKRDEPRGYWLGILLFSAYLCRPTSSVLILMTFVLVAWKFRSQMKKVIATSFGLFLLFIFWSWVEFGTLLPRYYDPTTWNTTSEVFPNILPVWIGPARGFFSFTPVFLLTFLGWSSSNIRKNPAFILIWFWFGLHTYLLLRSQSPWGGWCYGPRFFTELIPGFTWMLLMLTEAEWLKHSSRKGAFLIAFISFSVLGVAIHTYQGLFNEKTIGWNDAPSIDHNWQSRRMDWRYPQFLASQEMINRRLLETQIDTEIKQIFHRLPEGIPLLYGKPTPSIQSFANRWNRKQHFGANRFVFNSLYEVAKAGFKEFYFPLSILDELEGNKGLDLEQAGLNSRMTFSQFLEENKSHEIILAAKDEATSGISRESRIYLSQHGSQFDSLKLRESYIAVFKNGKIEYEAFGPELKRYELEGQGNIFIESAGLQYGNFAKIFVRGKDYSRNSRGLNVVVLDEQRNVIWTTSFDTHAEDFESISVMKARFRD